MDYNIAFARLEYVPLFLHIACVVIFAGCMLALTLVGRKLLVSENMESFSLLLWLCKSISPIIFISLSFIAISGAIVVYQNSKSIDISDPMAEAVLATKGALWIFLLLNCLYTLYNRKKAAKFFKAKDMIQTHESLILIVYYFLPLNLLILMVASYLGLSYRGFM